MAGQYSASIGLVMIVNELRSLREQRATGTYYIVSSDNRQVRLGLSAGEVNAISLRAPNLSSALDVIAGLQISRTSFAKDGLAIVAGAFGFSTDELIHGLLYRAGQSAPATQAASSKSAPAWTSAKSAPATTTAGAFLSQAQHVALRRLLIEHLGPMGEFVYEECRETTGTPNDLLAALAREIVDKRHAAQFLAQAKSLLVNGAG